MTTRATTVASTLACLLLLALAGCGGSDGSSANPSDSAEPSAPAKALAPGTCWDDTQLAAELGEKKFATWVKTHAGGDADLGESMRDDAAFSQEVACTEDHALELYNVVALPDALDARVTKYSDLLDQDTRLYRRVRDQVNDRCLARSPYGKAQRRARLPVQLGPSLNAASGLHVAWDPFPADLWSKGQRKFVCTFEQDTPGTLLFSDLTTRKVPLTARVCLNTPGTFIPCDRPHQAEDIGEMILNTAVERGLITGRKAVRRGGFVRLDKSEYAKLDRVCQALFRQVAKGRDGVEGQVYPGSVKQWPTASGDYVARCFALKPYDPIPPIRGTVFNRA